MSELQKCEQTAKRLANRITGLTFRASDTSTSSPTARALNDTNLFEQNFSSIPAPAQTNILLPSQSAINKFFDYLHLRVHEISIPLAKHKVSQYFHPSPLNALASEDVPAKITVLAQELFISNNDDALTHIQRRADKLFASLQSWNQQMWLEAHPGNETLILQETAEGSLLQINPEFVCVFVSELYELKDPLELDLYDQFLRCYSLDSISFLIIVYLYHYNVLVSETFAPSHLIFIDWINQIMPRESDDGIFQEEPTLKIKDVVVPSEIHQFLSHCCDGSRISLICTHIMIGTTLKRLQEHLDENSIIEKGCFENGRTALHYAVQVDIFRIASNQLHSLA